MPTINPTLPSDGDDAVVGPYNAAIQAILAVINGSIDEDNIAAGSIILSKLASAVQQALVPAGTILAYGAAAAPSGFLLCYGQAVSRSTYSDLFAIVGTSFGVGNGTSTFNLPDLRGRVPVGSEAMGGTTSNRIERSTNLNISSGSPTATPASMTGLSVGMSISATGVTAGTTILSMTTTTITMSANATATNASAAARFSLFANDAEVIGAVGGTDIHKLILGQLPTIPGAVYLGGGSNNGTFQSGASIVLSNITSTTVVDQAHPNLQPSQITTYIIKT